MVGVAQLAERRIVAPKVEGSSPFSHPICAVSSAGQSRGLLIPRSRVRIPDGAPCELRNARKAQASGRFLLRAACQVSVGEDVDMHEALCAPGVWLCSRGSEAEPCRWGGRQGVRGLGLAGVRVSKSVCGLMTLGHDTRSLGALAPLPSRVSSVKMRLPRRGNCFYFTW